MARNEIEVWLSPKNATAGAQWIWELTKVEALGPLREPAEIG